MKKNRKKGCAWHTAIGLHAVEGLETSEYLIETAKKNIEGDITFEEANNSIHSYYRENVKHNTGSRTEEADKVLVRIAQILSEKSFILYFTYTTAAKKVHKKRTAIARCSFLFNTRF